MKPVVDESMLPRRPLIYRIGKRARPLFDHVIARFSSISTGPLIDPAEFAWTADLGKEWRTIRAEAEALISDIRAVPPLRIMSP